MRGALTVRLRRVARGVGVWEEYELFRTVNLWQRSGLMATGKCQRQGEATVRLADESQDRPWRWKVDCAGGMRGEACIFLTQQSEGCVPQEEGEKLQGGCAVRWRGRQPCPTEQ